MQEAFDSAEEKLKSEMVMRALWTIGIGEIHHSSNNSAPSLDPETILVEWKW